MYSLLIMDDSEASREDAVRAVEDGPFARYFRITAVPSIGAALDYIAFHGAPDVLIADIQMGDSDRDGIDFVRDRLSCGTHTQVIYLTGFIEYCTKVYESQHIYFLTKPLVQVDFDKALDRALENLRQDASRKLAVSFNHETRVLDTDSIVYLESSRRKMLIHMKDGSVFETYATMADMLERLPRSFIQCHKSFVVNPDHVARLAKGHFESTTGAAIPLSSKYRQQAKEGFFDYIERC